MASSPTVTICIPVFNDWASVALLLPRLDQVAPLLGGAVSVLLVDDGSTGGGFDVLPPTRNLRAVEVLHLSRNVGHQRAIALGLAFVHARRLEHAGLVVVMDADGEDGPEDIPRLIARCADGGYRCVVFAQRARRSEGLGFRAGYLAFKAIHRLLTGRPVKVGNFSVMSAALLGRVVSISELWNHYAAGVFNARLPVDMVAIPRRARLAGTSNMDLTALVVHGMSAISVYGATVGVRLLWVTAVAMALTLVVLFGLGGMRVVGSFAVPNWASVAVGVLVVLLLELLMLSMAFVLFVLQSRNIQGFVPSRDWTSYVLSCEPAGGRDG